MNATPTTTKLITTRETARRLGVSIRTIERLAKRGLLPLVRVSFRAVRFREEDIEAFIKSRTTPRKE